VFCCASETRHVTGIACHPILLLVFYLISSHRPWNNSLDIKTLDVLFCLQSTYSSFGHRYLFKYFNSYFENGVARFIFNDSF
jgi:hypothetical protein